jgi:hypothetical protein
MLLTLEHSVYWIRLATQRVMGVLFTIIPKVEDAHSMLGKMVNAFKFKAQLNEDLGIQLVKNLTFLLRTCIQENQVDLAKLFAKCSFIGRKMMLNVQEAKDRIANLLLFFQVAIHLFEK